MRNFRAWLGYFVFALLGWYGGETFIHRVFASSIQSFAQVPAGGTGDRALTAGAVLIGSGVFPVQFAVTPNDATKALCGSNPPAFAATCAGSGGATTNQNLRQIAFHFDGGGSPLSGTITSCQRIQYAGAINGWYVDADVAGSGTIGVRSVAFASYTGVAGYSGYTDVTGGGTPPSISSGTNATFSNLTSWTTAVTAGQEWCFQLTAPATSTVIDGYLQVLAN